jgi:hypothetical protein
MARRWPTWLGFLVGLIALLLGLSSGSTPDDGWQLAARWTGRAAFPIFIVTFVASSLAYALLLAMVLTSNSAAQRRMGRGWTWLHRTGMWVFLVIFGQHGTRSPSPTHTHRSANLSAAIT